MISNSNNLLRRAIHNSLMGGAFVAAATFINIATAQAQTADTEQKPLEEVIVTGTRIAQPTIESVSPITAISAEEMKTEGLTRVEDLLNNLPQVFGDYGGNISNGATGEATVSLRGLGANRTLVLVNGRRLMPGDPTQNGNAAPDLNQIPSALVERIDVLTGGASAVYGADAVAGVVNFVMNDHFEGVRFDGNYSFYQHNQHSWVADLANSYGIAQPKGNVMDGYARDWNIIVGGNFADGKGNATLYAGYRNLSAQLQGNRDFSSCALSSSSGVLSCGGSSTSYPGRFRIGGVDYTVGANNQLRPFDTGTDLYNYAPTNYFQRPDERYTAGAFAHYDLNDHATAYMEVMFMDDRTIAQIAPSGAFYGAGNGVSATGIPDATWLVNCDNPYLSSSELATFCTSPDANGNAHVLIGRRNIEGGPRQDDLGHTSFRTVLGLRGSIADGWTYDAYALNGITRLSEQYLNDVSISRLANALQAVTDPLTGTVVCKANANGANGAPGCVPYNIYQIGGVTPAAIAYISVPGFQKGSTTERVVSAYVTGDLGKYDVTLPSAHDGLSISVGAEYREEKTELQPDLEYITNDLAGQGAPVLPTNGAYHVWEGYMEARLPILQDMPFAKSLSVDTGYRYSDYNIGFSTNTYKFGVEFAPINDFRVRGAYQRAVRAPNLQELYLQPRVQLDGTTDPCAGATPSYSLTQCALTGVTSTEYGNISKNTSPQYNGLVSGNPNLQPEKADTVTLGVVITPDALPDFNATIDYFDIKIKNVITTYGADFVITTCLNTGDPLYCNKIHRVPETGSGADGSLWIGSQGYIEDGTYNLGEQSTRGVDLNANYNFKMGPAGDLAFSFVGTYLMDFKTTPVPGGGSYDCAGLYGITCGVPAPVWRHKLRGTWTTPVSGLNLSLAWRYLNSVKVDHTSSNPLLSGALVEPGVKIGSYSYFDISGAYTLMKKYTFRLGINNILDKDPPIIAGYNQPSVYANGNTFPQVYDTLGRYVFLNLTADF